MSAPTRYRLLRQGGWRKPEGGIGVARPTRWGNPYIVGQPAPAGAIEGAPPQSVRLDYPTAVRLFEADLRLGPQEGLVKVSIDDVREHLAGHDLGCWCPLPAVCHGDVLLKIANEVSP